MSSMAVQHPASFVEFDYANWPTVVIRFTGQPKDDEDFHQYLEEIDRLYAHIEQQQPGNQPSLKAALIFDASQVQSMGIKYMYQQAQHMRTNRPKTKRCLSRASVVCLSVITRRLIDLVMSLCRPEIPVQTFEQLSLAQEWCNQISPVTASNGLTYHHPIEAQNLSAPA